MSSLSSLSILEALIRALTPKAGINLQSFKRIELTTRVSTIQVTEYWLIEEGGEQPCAFLFSFKGGIHKDFKGGHFFDEHKVFLIKADGAAKPRHEIRHIAYFNGSNVKVAAGSRKIIEKYWKNKIDSGTLT